MYVRLLLFFLTVLLIPVAAQEIDTAAAVPDVPAKNTQQWTRRLSPFVQDRPNTFQLYLPRDTWGHSDFYAAGSNPFISADILLGALRLDGSLGIPIHSAVIPSAAINCSGFFGSAEATMDDEIRPPYSGGDQAYLVAPMQDISRKNQTYFFWDQGDYGMQDIQIGGSTQIDDTRNLMLVGQTRCHPGPYSKSGPNAGDPDGNVLQNYILDYRSHVGPSLDVNYSVLYQKENVGLPLLNEYGILTSDRRYSSTLAHGIRLDWKLAALHLEVDAASMSNHLFTQTDGTAGKHVDRRSLSLWTGGSAAYDLSPVWRLVGSREVKQQIITDKALGYHISAWAHTSAGVSFTRDKLSAYSGLALNDDQLDLEGWLSWQTEKSGLQFSKESVAFLDYPHHNRRLLGDSVSWSANPVLLDRIRLMGNLQGSAGIISAQLAWLETSDGRTAITAGFMADWEVWPDILRFSGTITGVNTQTARVFPTRLYTQGGVSITAPMRRMRARPFAAAALSFISSDFAVWMDPRYADTAPWISLGGTTAAVSWLTAEAGLKARDFELRWRIYNPTQVTIQNSPSCYLPQEGWGDLRMQHYSLSWRFPPQAPKQSGPTATR